MDDYFLKPGYISRSKPEYFVDNTSEHEGLIWQPEAYLLAAHLARTYGCDTVLDLGCGRGLKLAGLHPEFQLKGVDYGANLAHCAETYPFGTWLEADFEHDVTLPLAPEALAHTVIVCADVIEHLIDPQPLLRLLARLLEHAPAAVLTTPERDRVRGETHMGPPDNPHHVREWNGLELGNLLEAHGLKVAHLGVTLDNARSQQQSTQLAVLAGARVVPAALEEIRGRWQAPRLNESVCIVSSEFLGPTRNGGIATHYTTLAERLAAHGIPVTLLYTLPEQCAEHDLGYWKDRFAEKSVTLVPLPHIAPDVDGPFHVRSSYAVYQWLKTQDFGLVHFAEWNGLGYYSLLAKHEGLAFRNTRMCVGTHGATYWTNEANGELVHNPAEIEIDFMERRSVELADVVHSPSAYMLKWEAGQGWAAPREKLLRPYILPLSARRASQPSSAPIRELVFFGRLETRKGPVVFCDALDRLVDSGKAPRNLKITFMGRPALIEGQPALELLNSRAKAWPWQVDFQSNFSQSEAMAYLQEPGRVAVIPSLIENSPNTVLECLGAGIPFLAAASGGIPELIAPDDVARVCFEPTATALTAALTRALQQGLTPARPSVEFAPNEAAWILWHAEQTWRAAVQAGRPTPEAAQPRISVIVTHYNRPELLDECLGALSAQDYRNFEVIVVDDGSSSPEAQRYLASIEPEFSRRGWQIVRQKNAYLGAARNNGVRHATGEYLVFVDDDDLPRANKLSIYAAVATHTGADILTCCNDYFNAESPLTGRYVPLGGCAAAGLFRNVFGGANGMIRRSVFDALGGYTELHGVGFEDWEFLAKAVLAGHTLLPVPEGLYRYRITANSMVRSTRHYANQQRKLAPYRAAVPTSLRALMPLLHNQHQSLSRVSTALARTQTQALLFGCERLLWAKQPVGAALLAHDAIEAAEQQSDSAVTIDVLLDATDLLIQADAPREARRALAKLEALATGAGRKDVTPKIKALSVRLETHPVAVAVARPTPAAPVAAPTPEAVLDALLDADDIIAAIEAHRADITPELLALVRATEQAAAERGEAELAEGLAALVAALAEKV